MELLIKNARITDAFQNFMGDIYINNGKISEIGLELIKNCKCIDVKGKTVLPSFVDMHCHFRDPGFTYKEDINTGSRAAVKGGYTAVNLMANTKPICSNMETVEYVLSKSREIGLVDIQQVVAITTNMDGMNIEHLDEIDSRVRFISDDGKGVDNSSVMANAMMKAKEMGITVISHAESKEFSKTDMRIAENLMTLRDLGLCESINCKLHMAHVSTKEAVNHIIESKKRGINVTCEVTPHHIALDESTEYRVNPPLRNKKDIESIIEAIKKGYIDIIATDHAPHTFEDKENGAPGISGLETSFAVSYTKLVLENNITLNQLSKLMSFNPARLMGLNKGRIIPGFDGDLVIVDLDKKYKIDNSKFESKGKNTPFNGKDVYGEILYTIKKGNIVYQNKK